MANPQNRAVDARQAATSKRRRDTGPLIRVRAKTAISEEIGGVQTFIAAGQEADLPESRVVALGPLVERIGPSKATETNQEIPAAG